MRESWVNFFWAGRIPDMEGLVAWQAHLKEKRSEFNTRCWVDDSLFSQLKNNPTISLENGQSSPLFESVIVKDPNTLEVACHGQKVVVSNFKEILDSARTEYPQCCNIFDLLEQDNLHAFASDFARLLILKYTAGFYCDFDIEPNPDAAFPQSLTQLIEATGISEPDDFVHRNIQVILTFDTETCAKVLRKYEDRQQQIDGRLVLTDISNHLNAVQAMRVVRDASYRENTPQYAEFKKVVHDAKRAYIGESVNGEDFFWRNVFLRNKASSDPYRVQRIERSVEFIYIDGVRLYTGNIPASEKEKFNLLVQEAFSNPIQDRMPGVFSWQNPELMRVLTQWHHAHRDIESMLNEIDLQFQNPDSDLQEIIPAFKNFVSGHDEALDAIKDKVFKEGTPLHVILTKHKLLSDENKIVIEKLTGELAMSEQTAAKERAAEHEQNAYNTLRKLLESSPLANRSANRIEILLGVNDMNFNRMMTLCMFCCNCTEECEVLWNKVKEELPEQLTTRQLSDLLKFECFTREDGAIVWNLYRDKLGELNANQIIKLINYNFFDDNQYWHAIENKLGALIENVEQFADLYKCPSLNDAQREQIVQSIGNKFRGWCEQNPDLERILLDWNKLSKDHRAFISKKIAPEEERQPPVAELLVTEGVFSPPSTPAAAVPTEQQTQIKKTR